MNKKRQNIPKSVEHQVREQCGQACAKPNCRKWNTATHELHHIDNDRSRSVLENLILLCANCHSDEQQGIITSAQINLWKQMADSGFLPPPAIVLADPARADRIRIAKAKVRDWIDVVASAHPMYLFNDHERISAALKSMKNLLVDDLPPESRERFISACSSFIETTDEECYPETTFSSTTRSPSKEDQDRKMEKWRKPGKLLTARLKEILDCI